MGEGAGKAGAYRDLEQDVGQVDVRHPARDSRLQGDETGWPLDLVERAEHELVAAVPAFDPGGRVAREVGRDLGCCSSGRPPGCWRIERAKPILAPDQQHVELPATGGLQHGTILGAIVSAAAGVVNELTDDRKAAMLGILAELAKLRFGILAAIHGGHPGVDGRTLHCRQYRRQPASCVKKGSPLLAGLAPHT